MTMRFSCDNEVFTLVGFEDLMSHLDLCAAHIFLRLCRESDEELLYALQSLFLGP